MTFYNTVKNTFYVYIHSNMVPNLFIQTLLNYFTKNTKTTTTKKNTREQLNIYIYLKVQFTMKHTYIVLEDTK